MGENVYHKFISSFISQYFKQDWQTSIVIYNTSRSSKVLQPKGVFMAEEIQNANIKIASAEDTGQQIKIRDQKRRTYSFFKTKKNGSQTQAFSNYQNFKIGDTVEIAYKNVPYKDGTIKNIMNMRPASGPVDENAEDVRLFQTRTQRGPGREYWEQREAKRQSSILMQVAFKAAIELQAAKVASGEAENREKLYADTLEFYDWVADQIGEELENNNQNARQAQPEQEQLITEEDIGF